MLECTAKSFIETFPTVDAKQIWNSEQTEFIDKMSYTEIAILAEKLKMQTVLELITKYKYMVATHQIYEPSFWELSERKDWKTMLDQCEKNAIVRAYVRSCSNEYREKKACHAKHDAKQKKERKHATRNIKRKK